jgi:hypothetical protein
VGRRRKKKHRKDNDQEVTGDDDDNYVMTNLPAIMRCIKENKPFRSFLFIS